MLRPTAWFQGRQRPVLIVAVVLLATSAAACIYRIWDVRYIHALTSWKKTPPAKPAHPPMPVYPGPADLSMSYGEFARPPLDDLTLMAALPAEYVPTEKNGRRLIVVGDIHGMNDELGRLLEQVEFNPATDHLVSAGDMVNKGPDSPGVVARLMALNASAVRGNHEDRVLLARAEAETRSGVSAELASPDADDHRGLARHVATARRLSPEQVAWLSALPVILTVDPLSIYVVHAGLVPGVRLERQDPWAAMNMRSLTYPREDLRRQENYRFWRDSKPAAEGAESNRDVAVPVDDHSGEKWAEAWNRHQGRVSTSERRTVIYGHDAKRGFVEGKHTMGLDSGCVYGGALSAMVIEATGRGGFSHLLRQELCEKPSRRRASK